MISIYYFKVKNIIGMIRELNKFAEKKTLEMNRSK